MPAQQQSPVRFCMRFLSNWVSGILQAQAKPLGLQHLLEFHKSKLNLLNCYCSYCIVILTLIVVISIDMLIINSHWGEFTSTSFCLIKLLRVLCMAMVPHTLVLKFTTLA